MEDLNDNEQRAMVRGIRPEEARVNITYSGQNGELADPVLFDAPEGDIKGWVTEALRAGSVAGIPAAATADLRDFVVDRFTATEARPYNLIQIRPKTAYGAGLTNHTHCWHLFRGALLMVVPDGHIVEKCCKCTATRSLHRDHAHEW